MIIKVFVFLKFEKNYIISHHTHKIENFNISCDYSFVDSMTNVQRIGLEYLHRNVFTKKDDSLQCHWDLG